VLIIVVRFLDGRRTPWQYPAERDMWAHRPSPLVQSRMCWRARV